MTSSTTPLSSRWFSAGEQTSFFFLVRLYALRKQLRFAIPTQKN
jgi:hypothetical protein